MLVMASEVSSLGPTVGFEHPVKEQRHPARAATAFFVLSENSSRLLIIFRLLSTWRINQALLLLLVVSVLQSVAFAPLAPPTDTLASPPLATITGCASRPATTRHYPGPADLGEPRSAL
jgi:hypothetical protein